MQQLIAYFNHGQQPEEMPSFYRLSGDMVLAQSNKGDCFYVTTPKSCSCPASVYNPGKPCKHSRKYFPQPKKSREELEAEGEAILYNTVKRLAIPPDIRDSLPGWPEGAHGPVEAI
ncbi:hypothetical protein ASZ90_013058 [hydrocarbon metagenome]|uniref:SWIM-type domain-containing protein n=1 Tax=hydrocarbon metagenome TaxID=938273 RepID=A0A0W8F8M2_9ZZZZ